MTSIGRWHADNARLPPGVRPRENKVGNEHRGVVVHCRLDVRIGLQGDRDVCVAEMLLDHTRVNAVGKGDRCPCVAQAVGRKVRNLVLVDSPLERLVDTLGMERPSIRLAEDVVLINEAGLTSSRCWSIRRR